jgi:peptidoglycan/xylan/chitin deacetylase (PgdA/CDA1 family)
MCVEREWLARRSTPRVAEPRILCYHSIGQPHMGVNDVVPSRFLRHLEWALDAGHRFVPARRIASGEAADGDLAITFDDALRSVGEFAAPVLQELGIPYTVFVVTGWSGHAEPWQVQETLGWAELAELAAAGAEIGSHAVTHTDFATLGVEAARDELVRSKRTIEEELRRTVTGFAIPFGQSANWSAELTDMAHEAGYGEIYAQSVTRRSPGTVARTFITGLDNERTFKAALGGAYDNWEEWY